MEGDDGEVSQSLVLDSSPFFGYEIAETERSDAKGPTGVGASLEVEDFHEDGRDGERRMRDASLMR